MPDLIFRVSQVDVFRAWEQNQEADMDWLMKALESKEPTPEMLRGTAFHAALEKLREGEVERIDQDGYTFIFDGDFSVPSFPVREIRRNKDYGGIVVSGQCDAISGIHILDHKTTSSFDAERYYAKYQWRYYLDIFNSERFTWYVWEMQEADTVDENKLFVVRDLHVLEQYRYPGMERDCRELAQRLKRFAEAHLPKTKTATKNDLVNELVP